MNTQNNPGVPVADGPMPMVTPARRAGAGVLPDCRAAANPVDAHEPQIITQLGHMVLHHSILRQAIQDVRLMMPRVDTTCTSWPR